ncbi:TetR/AcrR family transcriptional regulator [Patulibacter defluvii]|uniref:TetR/AcrR family transcriptional regulator n=1 Tax=Patulibacter defluvii TaxID=3095358 RepID=UPI002A74BB1D|nr:hypothetical protein [Patulibacter sp. DM4]
MVKNPASGTAPEGVRRQARGEQRRDQLLRATLRIVASEGTAGVSQRRVAREADVPPSLPTYYFASVDELLEEALRLFARERAAMLRQLAASFDRATMTPEQIGQLLAVALVDGDSEAEIAQIELYLEAGRRPVLQEAVLACLDAYREVAAAALRAAGATRPEEGAVTFVALIDGLGVTKATGTLATMTRDERVAMLAAMIRDVFVPYALRREERDAWDERLGVSRRGPELRPPAADGAPDAPAR